MSKIKLLLLIIDLVLIHTVDSSNVYHITPSPTAWCPGESCLTLSILAANSSDYLDSNTTLVFLEGSHTLDSELNIVLNTTGSVILSTNGSGIAAITCSSRGGLRFSHINQLQISGLEFIRCSSKVEFVDQFTLENSRFCGGNDDSAIHLNHTNASIVRSSFVSNTAGNHQSNVQILAYVRDNYREFSWPWPNIQSTHASVGGALIVTSSTVNISSSSFESNTAKVGGAIFSQLGSNITINNCTFINNSVTGCSDHCGNRYSYGCTVDDRCHGGALFIDIGCTVTAHNSTFMNNTAGYAGGAIALFQGTFLDSAHNMFSSNRAGTLGGAISAYDRSKITIDNSHYSNNTGRYGGAIYTQCRRYRYCSITVGNSSFDNNEAGWSGGVMYAYYRSSITVGNSSFDNNEAGSAGGVMHARYSSSITVGNSSFDNNEAGWSGGVMYAYSRSSITVGNSSFDNNEAGSVGGVMHARYSSSITVGNSSFDNNEAGSEGGVMHARYSSSITVGNSSFNNNEAGWSGGVMYAYSRSSITVGNSSFDNNEAGSVGGVMSANYYSSITAGNSPFDNNEAGWRGGVVYADYYSSITVGNSSFDNNEAGSEGGVMSARYNSSITVGNSSFDNNEAGSDGGVMYADYRSSITVGNSSFDSNEAGSDGGVMYARYRSGITVGNSSFDNNEAGSEGGVMFASSSSITVGNSSFDNNEAGSEGGVMSARYNSSITVGNSSFDNNEAGSEGGVMFASSSSITVGNSSFDNNEAGSEGGVMSARYNSSITVGNSSFDNNEAGSEGGVMFASSSSITVGNSSFDNNEAGSEGGVMHTSNDSSITVDNSSFDSNVAGNGGVMCASSSSRITVGNSSFDNNEAGSDGGVIYATFSSHISMSNSSFINNTANNSGGVVYEHSNTTAIFKSNCEFFNNSALEGGVVYVHTGSFTGLDNMYIGNIANNGGVIVLVIGDVNVMASSFLNNTAENIGGILYVLNSADVTLAGSTFHSNRAIRGGVIALLVNDNLTVTDSSFSHNSAIRGGVIYLLIGNKLTVKYSNFSHNSANGNGGVVYSADQNILIVDNSILNFNKADNNGGVLCSLFRTELFLMGDNCTFIGNQGHRGGVVYVSESKINVHCQWLLMDSNRAVEDGGAIHLFSANITFYSEHNTIVGNVAKSGGAIYASESQLAVEENSSTNLSNNLAVHQGGGIHAANSSIIIEGEFHLISNTAENGGAISLERNTVLQGKNVSIDLASNRAKHHGGALYVHDKTNPEMCAAITARNKTVSSKIECFFKSVFIHFSNNSADISGTNLFGGLLDRCIMHTTRKSYEHPGGLANFQNSSSIDESQLGTISSHPVQICVCISGQPDCDYQPEPIQINRGKPFSIEFVAYDQVHHPINASIQCSLNSSAGGLGVGQEIQDINKGCSALKYNLYTPNNYEQLTLSAVRGPCNNIAGISERNIMIEIICSCPIGFQKSENNNETSCDCICDQVLRLYEKTVCNPTTEFIIRREDFWISYINHTWTNLSGYVIYPHCPFDYCYTPDKSISINLNLPNGSNAQCDSNRVGTLCGTCKQGLSVSLGSSKCMPCPTYWPGLLVTITIVFIISGIGLVAFLLALNLTVAIGTVNAIIFYANIIAASKSALFPSGVSPASVFISWLNFDIGFDVCFFDGMDTYTKTWLQLAFPAYIIILVVVIIQLSYYSSAFGRLVGKKDPVATLATLILFSYAKLLQTIITAFSSATLHYPDGSKKTLWLPDATLEHFTRKHAVLFFIAILILLAGLIYTFLLFSWQWFLWCPRKRIKWIRNQKLSSFIEIYLVPYTPKHRYWTGLLILVRVSVYLVSVFNPSGDPRVTLSATTFIMTSLFLYIATFGVRMYKNRFINIMETLTLFNIIALSIFTWYTVDADTNQTAITNVSVGITFVQLTAVILYHAYRHMNQKLFTMIQGSAICIKMKEKLIPKKQKRVNNHNRVPVDEDIHQFHMLLDMIDRPANTNDYNIPQVQPKPIEPTQSVVEIPKPIQAAPATPPPPPLEAIKEEPELEYLQQEEESEQDGIDMIPVTENLATEINKNKQCINNCPGIEISECDNTSCTNPKNDMEYGCTILEEKSIPIPHSNPQINSYSKNKQAKEEKAMELIQSEDKAQSSQDVHPFPADSGRQEECGSHCIIVEAEVHDC